MAAHQVALRKHREHRGRQASSRRTQTERNRPVVTVARRLSLISAAGLAGLLAGLLGLAGCRSTLAPGEQAALTHIFLSLHNGTRGTLRGSSSELLPRDGLHRALQGNFRGKPALEVASASPRTGRDVGSNDSAAHPARAYFFSSWYSCSVLMPHRPALSTCPATRPSTTVIAVSME